MRILFTRTEFRQFIFRHRGGIPLPFVIVAIVCTDPAYPGDRALSMGLAAFGIVLAALGQIIRVWSISQAGRTTRSRVLQAPYLATGGPYAYVRNPIYLGNGLIGLGVVLYTRIPWLIALFPVLFALEYGAIVSAEEAFLRKRFGKEYVRYCQKVPRWLPRFHRISGGLAPIDWSAMGGKEYQSVLWAAMTIIVIAIRRMLGG